MRKLLALASGFLICAAAVAAHPPIKPGDVPPAYLGKTLSGKKVNLMALRGDVVVISFWATWCHYCIKELPVRAGTRRIATKKGLHIQVVAVAHDERRHIFYRAAHLLKSRLPNLLITSDPRGKIGKP